GLRITPLSGREWPGMLLGRRPMPQAALPSPPYPSGEGLRRRDEATARTCPQTRRAGRLPAAAMDGRGSGSHMAMHPGGAAAAKLPAGASDSSAHPSAQLHGYAKGSQRACAVAEASSASSPGDMPYSTASIAVMRCTPLALIA